MTLRGYDYGYWMIEPKRGESRVISKGFAIVETEKDLNQALEPLFPFELISS